MFLLFRLVVELKLGSSNKWRAEEVEILMGKWTMHYVLFDVIMQLCRVTHFWWILVIVRCETLGCVLFISWTVLKRAAQQKEIFRFAFTMAFWNVSKMTRVWSMNRPKWMNASFVSHNAVSVFFFFLGGSNLNWLCHFKDKMDLCWFVAHRIFSNEMQKLCKYAKIHISFPESSKCLGSEGCTHDTTKMHS